MAADDDEAGPARDTLAAAAAASDAACDCSSSHAQYRLVLSNWLPVLPPAPACDCDAIRTKGRTLSFDAHSSKDGYGYGTLELTIA